ncbi:MAG: NAD(P)-dependent oxidoreductase [Candidatus Methanomethylicia archaeon]
MKVLVTGASGFLGGYVIKRLMERGYNVRGTIRTPGKERKLADMNIETVHMDLLKPENFSTILKGMDAIIHLAAYYTFTGRKELYKRINVEGTRLLAEAALKSGIKRFIYCSSTEAIGPVEKPPGNEETTPNPQFEYGRSKLEAEKAIMKLGNLGLEYTIIRPSGLYGPGNINDVSYWFITSVAKGGILSKLMIGDGNALVQFAHVDDVARGFTLALEKGQIAFKETYILSEERAYTYKEVYNILSEILDMEPPKYSIPPSIAKILLTFTEAYDKLRGGNNFLLRRMLVDAVTKHRAYSIEKARRELGYTPKYNLREGLRETIEWYMDQGIIKINK